MNRAAKIHSLLSALKACGRSGDLARARVLHAAAADCGSSILVSNTLVSMYFKCGSSEEARRVFDRMPQHNVVSWNALLLGYVEIGQGEIALRLFFNAMTAEGCEPDCLTFVAALKGCSCSSADSAVGFLIHSLAADCGCDDHIFVQNSLIDMYGKSGESAVIAARLVFDRMKFHSVISWTAMILAYADNAEEDLALQLFSAMRLQSGCSPDSRTFVAALKACAGLALKETGQTIAGKLVKLASVEKVMEIHAQAEKTGVDCDIYVASSLVNAYSKCGCLEAALRVVSGSRVRNMVTVNALILGFAENGEEEAALTLFFDVAGQCSGDDCLTFVSALKACSHLAAKEGWCLADGKLIKTDSLGKGRMIHLESVRCGCDSTAYVTNTLIDLYAKCGSLTDARRVFSNRSFKLDVVAWNNLILGNLENGEGEAALELFHGLLNEGCFPDSRTFVAAFKACTVLSDKEQRREVASGRFEKPAALRKGRNIHALAGSCGLELSDKFVASTVVDLYGKCGSLEDAVEVFNGITDRDVVSWTSVMLAFADAEQGGKVLGLFSKMQQEGCKPNALSFVAALKACVSLTADVAVIRLADVHAQAESAGYGADILVMNTALDVYVECGCLLEAKRAFDSMEFRSVVTWNTLILGYAEKGGEVAEEALSLFFSMQDQSLVPNVATFVAVLKACGCVVLPEAGKRIHSAICRLGLESHEILVNCLMDFYGRCGSMVEAQQVFDSFYCSDVVSWNSLISVCGRLGDTSRVLGLFGMMQEEGIKVDAVTFVLVLAACSHAGLIDKGKEFFKAMVTKYEVTPIREHYHCLIDILGRCNEVEEAIKTVEGMPYKPNGVTWRTILAASEKWKSDAIGKVAFESLLKVEEEDPTAYVLMAKLAT